MPPSVWVYNDLISDFRPPDFVSDQCAATSTMTVVSRELHAVNQAEHERRAFDVLTAHLMQAMAGE